jgi:hypothetical protein
MKKDTKKVLNILLSEEDIAFLMQYGKGESVTECVEAAIQRLRTLEFVREK